jgi:hypothetical protein
MAAVVQLDRTLFPKKSITCQEIGNDDPSAAMRVKRMATLC